MSTKMNNHEPCLPKAKVHASKPRTAPTAVSIAENAILAVQRTQGIKKELRSV